MAYTYEIWDKVSEINRISAADFMRHHEIREEDQVYLIKQGNRVVCVQTNLDSPYADAARSIDEMARLHLDEFLALSSGE